MATAALRQVLARRLRAELGRIGRPVVTLAGLADMSPTHLYDLLDGRKAATVDVLEKIADALQVAPWELLRDPDEGQTARISSRRPRRSQISTSRVPRKR